MSAQRHRWNRRKAMAALLAVSVLLLAAIAIAGQVLREQALATDFTRKNLPPSLSYPFGTDWMGRDMFVRSLTGLSISIRIGLFDGMHQRGGGFHSGEPWQPVWAGPRMLS